MARLREYALYVDGVCPAEEACGPACTEHREVLEKAWQVVASEHYSASGAFSQAGWADTLLTTLKSRGGLLRTDRELQSAISAMLATLADPYTEFLPPSAFRRALRRPLPAEQSYLRAQYVGLGLELGPVAPGGGRVVLAPLADSPAEAAGIARGDRLISIDGTRTDQLDFPALRGLMRGPAGSTATLEWVPAPTAAAASPTATATTPTATPTTPTATAAAGPVRRLDVERRDLPQPAIKVSQLLLPSTASPTAATTAATTATATAPALAPPEPAGGGAGGPPPPRYATYVRLLFFGSETSQGLAAALRQHEADPLNLGYILDLRNNPGGVFEEGVLAASYFLQRGDVIAQTVRGPEGLVDAVWQVGTLPAEVFPELPGRLSAKPVILLVNRSTASASEVFAGAMRDNGRAVLLGERTFGKGLVQYYFPLSGGKDGGVRVTVAKYLTPSGYDITARGAGLLPDLACSDFPHGGPPHGLGEADECVRQASRLLQAGA